MPSRSLTKMILMMLAVAALLPIAIISVLWISFERRQAALERENLAAAYLNAERGIINSETSRISNYINRRRNHDEIRHLTALRDQTLKAYDLIDHIYQLYVGRLPEGQLRQMLLNVVHSLSPDEDGSRYYLIELKDQRILSPADLYLSGQNMRQASPYYERAFFDELFGTLNLFGEAFYQYRWFKNGDRESQPLLRVNYFKIFKPCGWALGFGKYVDDLETPVKQEVLDWVRLTGVPDNNHVMIITYEGDILAHTESSLTGLNMFDDEAPAKIQKIAAAIIRAAKERGQGFIRYEGPSFRTGRSGENMAYFQTVPDWRWIVVTGVYLEDLDKTLTTRQNALIAGQRARLFQISAITVSIFALILLLFRIISSLANRSFKSFYNFFERAATEATVINPREQSFKEFALLAEAANKMITERNLADRLLKESQLRFKTIFDVSPQIITIFNHSERLLEVNEEYRRVTGRDLNGALGLPLERAFDLKPNEYKELRRRLFLEGDVSGLEVNLAGGRKGPISLLVFGKKINLADRAAYLAIFVDISRLKSAENEKMVLQERLARSRKMEAMGLMAAEVAHDLNNILSGIIGYPELLLMERNLTPAQRQIVNDILEAGHKAAAVVSNLLTMSRGVAVMKEPLNLNAIVARYLESPEFRELKESGPNIEVKAELEPNLGYIMESPIHLTKLIMNLVSNSFEALGPERTGGRVELSTSEAEFAQVVTNRLGREELAPGRYARLEIRDNGPGLGDENVERVFEPFYSKKPAGQSGAGLGLAIVWNTIKSHNGYIQAETSPEGAVFTMYFPLTEARPDPGLKKGRPEELRGRNEKILVVDDLDIQRKLAVKMLVKLGYDPVAVSSGEEAVEYLRNHDAALVVLDMIMHPGMNGRETLARIKELKPRQKAIIASGMAETGEVEKAQQLGAGQFLKKPYTIQELGAAVSRALAPGSKKHGLEINAGPAS